MSGNSEGNGHNKVIFLSGNKKISTFFPLLHSVFNITVTLSFFFYFNTNKMVAYT